MKPSPYLIEFHGGRFDGLRQPSEFALASTRLEIPGSDLAIRNGVAVRRIYALRRSTVIFVEQSPVVTYHMYFIGAATAYSFGPLLRFAYGAKYVAKRASAHLAAV